VDVYGRPAAKIPIREETPLKLDSPYAVAKFASENILRLACDRVNTSCLILRLPGVFGRGDTSNRLVAGMLRAAIANKVFLVDGDGRQKRDLVWSEDIARLI
jgi:nucleoside-diphosphate-sugar epimerase